ESGNCACLFGFVGRVKEYFFYRFNDDMNSCHMRLLDPVRSGKSFDYPFQIGKSFTSTSVFTQKGDGNHLLFSRCKTSLQKIFRITASSKDSENISLYS